DTVQHRGPSAIGIDTLYMSHGLIPEAFLRGCGVPDAHIKNLSLLLGAMQPIQFYRYFISYSSKDVTLARQLRKQLGAEQLQIWITSEDRRSGRHQDRHTISANDKLLVILSPDSCQARQVMAELRKARTAELRDNRRKLFPIRLMSEEALRDWECIDP